MKFAQKVFEGKTQDMSLATKDFDNLSKLDCSSSSSSSSKYLVLPNISTNIQESLYAKQYPVFATVLHKWYNLIFISNELQNF